ncbi:MAG TPA: allophanate hydrolase subunit 1 [Idiomarina sp.]|uniref:5-oxoprolinase subunit PxpB n=3 Tax=Idiomarinaceae TaxID=267893 RepID=UPI0007940E45|nr:5-oxoprolinase subunit PxpB [Idiomarina sp. T82-3]KXS35579.1 MAG: Allophanate hydrolase subunit 1 [Idiomarina sp. T82-3]MBL73355.1 allophanate hydrolase [Idiomarinaceae bacterium]HAE90669.1 allophanate hydrolase subunit 1 [Idiomarina sp.]
MKPSIVNAGADAVIVYFADEISIEANQRVLQLDSAIASSDLAILETVPAYSSLMVYYDITRHSDTDIRASIKAIIESLPELQQVNAEQGQTHVIPVYYDETVGPDLARIAELHECSVEEVIERHCRDSYRVYALGFAPGFAYMGEVAEDLQAPRLDSPRTRIPAGSVAIAERQTAIYPLASPGGWNIIGRTTFPLYEPQKGILNQLNSGDTVRFKAISKDEFIAAGGSVEAFE